jgi:FAD-dependent urate hydroxylase
MYGLNVVVVGAGVGGLATAIALRRGGFEVTVYERAPVLLPIGAGVCMWPNGAKALNALGGERTAVNLAPELEHVVYRDKTGALISQMSVSSLVEAVGQRPYPLSRAHLHQVLLEQLGPDGLMLGRECVAVEQEKGMVTAYFADGTSASGDIVVGADGVHSVTRRHVAGEIPFRYMYSSWVGLVPADPRVNPPETFTFFLGDDQRVGILPVGDGQFYFFCDVPLAEDDEAADTGVLRRFFAGWDERVAMLLDSMEEASVTRLPIGDIDPIASYVRGRVPLVGDAAHATTPTLGQGGALAMEDAIVLAHYLITTSVSIEDALQRYDMERRPRAGAVQLAARRRTEVMLGHASAEEKQSWMASVSGGFADFLVTLEKVALEGPLR